MFTYLQSQWEVPNAVMDKGPILTPVNKSKPIRALELHYPMIQFLTAFLCNKIKCFRGSPGDYSSLNVKIRK